MSSPLSRLDTIETAIAAIKDGRPVVVVDDEDRENEGDLIFAAEKATPELLAFMVRHTSGFICAPLTEADADRLDLPPMYYTNQDRRGTAYTVTVDAREGVTTGISAAERAHTIRLLADPATEPGRPGPARPRGAAAGQGRRRAAPARPHRGRRRPGPAGRPAPGRRAVRAGQRRRHHDARCRTCAAFADEHGLVPDHHRRPDRLPAGARTSRSSGSPRPGCPPSTATSGRRLPRRSRRQRARRAGLRRPRRRRGRAGPGALRVPHRRRLRLAALRLRPAAAGRAARASPRRAAAWCSTCAATRAAASA